MRVLVIEDETGLAENISAALREGPHLDTLNSLRMNNRYAGCSE